MSEKVTLIKCGNLYDGIHDILQPDMQILVKGNRIEEIGKAVVCTADAEVIDLSGYTVTPGVMDAHVHPEIMDWHKGLTYGDDTTAALACARNAEKSLHRGFTSIRAAGAFGCCGYVFHEVRNAINAGYYAGSRLVIAQGTGTTGSHGDFSKMHHLPASLDCIFEKQHVGIGNGVDFFTASIRQQKKYGYDFVKIMATGGFATPGDSPIDQQLSDAELDAIMGTAHQNGMTVTAHAYFDGLIENLVNHGIDGIEHAACISKRVADLMTEKDVYVVPTFCPYQPVVYWNEEDMKKKSIFAQQKYKIYREQFIESRKVLIDSDLRLGYGTDFVNTHYCYESGYEYKAWLESGIDPYRALRAATSNNADILGLKDCGRLEAGKLADIVAWKRDVMTDPYALLDCAFVMKDGVVYEAESCLE